MRWGGALCALFLCLVACLLVVAIRVKTLELRNLAQRVHTESLHAEVTALSERCLFTAVLRHTNGNQVQASRILGITRVTLRNKLRLYGITPETFAG